MAACSYSPSENISRSQRLQLLLPVTVPASLTPLLAEPRGATAEGSVGPRRSDLVPSVPRDVKAPWTLPEHSVLQRLSFPASIFFQ